MPGDVDLLVAGTSCVDYSNLNNEKQDIDTNGETGRTFLVKLEIVCVHYFERTTTALKLTVLLRQSLESSPERRPVYGLWPSVRV